MSADGKDEEGLVLDAGVIYNNRDMVISLVNLLTAYSASL